MRQEEGEADHDDGIMRKRRRRRRRERRRTMERDPYFGPEESKKFGVEVEKRKKRIEL